MTCASPMQSTPEAFKLANGLFLIPLMMVYSPLLLSDNNGWSAVMLAGAVTLAMIVALEAVIESYRFTVVSNPWPLPGVATIALILDPIDWIDSVGVWGLRYPNYV